MTSESCKESPRRRIGRRVGAAGMALAAALALGACQGEGGGYIGAPVPGGQLTPVFNGQGRLRL